VVQRRGLAPYACVDLFSAAAVAAAAEAATNRRPKGLLLATKEA
jgi:hypothetical protein